VVFEAFSDYSFEINKTNTTSAPLPAVMAVCVKLFLFVNPTIVTFTTGQRGKHHRKA